MIVADAFAASAETLVGTPYRVHGRNAGLGLDCVGVVLVALRAVGVHVGANVDTVYARADYCEISATMARLGFGQKSTNTTARGDVLVMVCGASPHLAIATGASFVHAHAGIGRVVDGPAESGWRAVRAWALQADYYL